MRVLFNKENLVTALTKIQIVSPTDKNYPSDWYGNGFGAKVLEAQRIYVQVFKIKLRDCTSKEQINQSFIDMPCPKWPMDAGMRFWIDGFGKDILSAWSKMIKKFIDDINSLEGANF